MGGMGNPMKVLGLEATGPKIAKALWLVIGFALVICLFGINYGLPFIYWVDDYHEVMRAIELGAGKYDLLSTKKGGLYYLLFVEYGFYFVGLKLSGAIASTKEFAQLFARDPSMFYLMGRVTTVIFGSATVLAGRMSIRFGDAWYRHRRFSPEL